MLSMAIWSAVVVGAALVTIFQHTPLLNASVLASRTALDPARMTPRGGHAYHHPGWWFGWGDSPDHRRSAVRLFEDDRELALSHAVHDVISEQGGGRWSHWTRSIILSASDNSDPRTNGRRYTAVGLTLPVRLGAPLLAVVALIMAWRSLRRLMRSAPRPHGVDKPEATAAAIEGAARAPRRWMLVAGSLAVTLLLLVILLVIVEVLLRWRAPAPAEAHLRLAPGVGWARSGEPARRIDPRDPANDSGFRVLFIGDSFSHHRTWCDQTIARLHEAGIPAVGFEAGVSGYGTTQEYLLLRQLLPVIQPDAVVLQMYAWNDPRDNWSYPGLTYNPRMTLRPVMDDGGEVREPSAFAIACRSTELWKQLLEPTLDRMRRTAAEARLEASSIDAMAAERDSILLDYAEPRAWTPFYRPSMQDGAFVTGAWRVTGRALQSMRDFCADAGVPLLVVALDAPFTVDSAALEASVPADLRAANDFDGDLPLRHLRARAESLGLNFIDLVPALRARRDRLEGTAQYDGSEIGAHLLPEAEEVFADVVKPWLEEQARRDQRRR